MRKKIIYTLLLSALFSFNSLAAKNYTDAERAEICKDINDGTRVEYARMGIEPSVLTLKVVYEPRSKSMLLYYSGTMLINSTVEDLRASWITRMNLRGNDPVNGNEAMKGSGFSGYTFYANGKSCRYNL